MVHHGTYDNHVHSTKNFVLLDHYAEIAQILKLAFLLVPLNALEVDLFR